MKQVEQGDLLRVDGIPHRVVVVSNNYFNRSGKVIACPVLPRAAEGPLHIRPKHTDAVGVVLCEQPRYLDLETRHYAGTGSLHYYDTMDISDAVMGIFDYQEG